MGPHTVPTPPQARLLTRLAAIADSLASRDDALALLALGSVGQETDRLDEWSDLDFFVLVRDGAKARYIARLDWLAQAHPLAWHFQNTVDGHKALMDDGVYCEFAVFELHELPGIAYAPGRFVWRRDEVDAALAAPARRLPTTPGRDWLVGEALSNLIVGLQRHARGEKLAAMRLVQVHALDRVLELLDLLDEQGGPAADASARRDPFNVDRRIEARRAGHGLADRIDLAVCAGGYQGTVAAARSLLAVLQAHAAVPPGVAAHIESLMLPTAGRPVSAPAGPRQPPRQEPTAMPFVERDFVIPEPPATAEFLLTPLRVDHVVLDFDAVMTSRERLWTLFGAGWGWPREDLSLMQDLIDLGWHQKEFQLRRSFNWAVLTPDERTLLGCCYLDPSDREGYEAEAFYWVRSDRIDSGLEDRVSAVFRGWLAGQWPFARIAWPGRDEAW